MTEPLRVAIQNALHAQLKTPDIQAPSTTSIAWPMVDYTPTPGTIYLDVKPLMLADPEHFGIATENSDIERGIFQVDVVAPNTGKGEAPGQRLAALVKARFALDTKLPVNGRWLHIIAPPSIAAAIPDAPWQRFPVSIRYQLIT